MDADGIERVGLINYVSPDVMGFTGEVNEWMMRYAAADPRGSSLSARSIRHSRTMPLGRQTG